MNKSHDYRALEREFVTSQISLRELCRRHGITAHSLITVQAKKHQWVEKREAYRAKESESFIETYAERMADKRAEISDKALEAIDEAITKFREDMQATDKTLVNGEWVEVPAWYMQPKDMAILIDRLMVLFERPSAISQHRGLSVTSEVTPDALRDFIEATRGLGEPPRMEESPLPRTRRLDD